MKRLFILTLTIVCFGIYQESDAEIRNGYDVEVKKAAKWIHNLKEIAKKAVSPDQHDKLEKWLKAAHATADKVRKNHAKTQELIEKLKIITPRLYHEINTIKDREGNDTHVYIKVVDRLEGRLLGATNVSHSVGNPNIYSSEYGDYTVSVKVTSRFPRFSRHSLKILVHELGHVRYQVPHLTDYTAFYKNFYQNRYFEGFNNGHHPKDLSHQSVIETLNAFKKSWRENKREMKWIAQSNSLKMMASTREN